MKKLALGLMALTFVATPALAQTSMTFADVDLDASGELSFAELQAAWPDLTQDEFTAADMDANGSLSADEVAALQPTTLPASAPMDGGPMDRGMSAPAAPAEVPQSLSDTVED